MCDCVGGCGGEGMCGCVCVGGGGGGMREEKGMLYAKCNTTTDDLYQILLFYTELSHIFYNYKDIHVPFSDRPVQTVLAAAIVLLEK